MSSTVANSGSEPVNPASFAASRPTTLQAAWNAPIFSLPVEVEQQATPKEIVPAAIVPAKTAPAKSAPAETAPAVVVPAVVVPAAVEQTVPAPPKASVPRTLRFIRGERSAIWGLRLDCIRMEETVDAVAAMIAERTPRFIITANVNYAMLVDRDESLQAITDEASLVLADGQPLVWRSKIGTAARLPERVAGSELIYRLAERAAERGWRIYFLGAEAGVAQRCADTLAQYYPGLQIAGVQSPPYRKLSDLEQQQQRQAIIDSRADILLVAFGQPKGERWIHQHYQQLGVPVSIQVGASFDFVAGTARRAPLVWQRLGLEWCYRMCSDPRRLVPRYISNAAFVLLSLIRDWRDYVDSRYGPAADVVSRGH